MSFQCKDRSCLSLNRSSGCCVGEACEKAEQGEEEERCWGGSDGESRVACSGLQD